MAVVIFTLEYAVRVYAAPEAYPVSRERVAERIVERRPWAREDGDLSLDRGLNE